MNDVKQGNEQDGGTLNSSAIDARVPKGFDEDERLNDMELSALASLSQPNEAFSNTLFEGDGGNDLRLVVLAPELQDAASDNTQPDTQETAPDHSWLAVYVQDILHKSFCKYSAMTLIDRQTLNQILATRNLAASQHFSEEDLISIGNLSNAHYVLSGTIQKLPNQEFSINLSINEAGTRESKAAFMKNSPIEALKDATLINEATESLLSQMGINLTEIGRRSLAEDRYMDARDIVAQKSEDTVETMISSAQAVSFELTQLQSLSRIASTSSPETDGGSVSANILNDLLARRAWMEVLKEAAEFFNKHPPFEITYDTALMQLGTTDYVQEQVNLSTNIRITPSEAGFATLNALLAELDKTGKRETWGFAAWPFIAISPQNPETSLFVGKVSLDFVVDAALINENGTIIARGKVTLNTSNFSFTAGDKTISAPAGELKQLQFSNVNVSDLTPKLTVMIAAVNGKSGRQICETLYMKIVPDEEVVEESSPVKVLEEEVKPEPVVIEEPKQAVPLDPNSTLTAPRDFILAATGSGVVIKKYKGADVSIIIPETLNGKNVIGIADKAFAGCADLTAVSLPASVASIGNSAFARCAGLTSITLPPSVTSIGEWAFESCVGLTSITLPPSVTSIGRGAFSGCIDLSAIMIPASVTSIGRGAFSGCDILSSIEIEPSNEYYKIMDGVLFSKDGRLLHSYLSGRTSYNIPDNVTSIGDSAFSGCAVLRSVTIPPSVTSIGRGAFSGCDILRSVTIPASVTSIGDSVFADCDSLRSVTISSNITALGDSVFSWCTSLSAITIPSSVTSIGESAFSGCSSLTSILIPSNVTTIGARAFYSCYSLTSVTIPSNVITIGDEAFWGCSNLTSILIPPNVSTIGVRAFAFCGSLTSIKIPASVMSIGDEALFGCSKLDAASRADIERRFVSKVFEW